MRDLISTALSVVNKAPVPYAPRGTGGFASTYLGRGRNNPTAQLDAYGSLGVLFGIVNRTSTATAKVGWKLYRKAKSGKKEDRTEVTSHAALDIWNRPNNFHTQREFVEAGQQHLDLTGEMWWVVARHQAMRSLPLELWTVRPDRMRPVPDPENFISHYEYSSPDGQTIRLELDQVIQIKMPHPTDPYRGCGPVQALLTSIDSVRYSEEWNRNFFVNSAEPGGLIEVEKRLSDDEFDEMTTRWREQHQGVANAHRVGIIEQGKWVNRTFTMRDMQFAELAAVGDAKIRQAFGMPKFALGDVDDVNRATAEASKVWFGEELTVPRLDRIKDALNFRFLPMFGPAAQGLEFDHEDPVPQDAEARDRERTSKATAAKTYTDAGWNGESVKEALELPEALVWEGKPEPQLAPVRVVPDDQAVDATFRQITAHLLRRPRTALEVRAQADLDQVQEDWQSALDQLVTDWEQISAAQREQIADQVRTAVNSGDLAALAALTVGSAAGAELLAAAMTALASTAAARVVEEAAAQDVAISPATVAAGSVAAAASSATALIAAGLAVTAGREALRWVGYSHTGDQVATAVTEHLAGLSDAGLRAQLGSLLTWAQNAARIATLQAAPTATWYASEKNDDRNRCQPCKNIDGAKLPTLDAMLLAYGGGGYLHCEGGPRCRGTVVAIWEEG